MTKFLDGPAAGVTLMLHRAPHYLRAVRNAAGVWDALDQLGDEPKSNETIVVYEMASGPTRIHLQRRERGHRVCGWFEGGDYSLVEPQPADDAVRSTTAWRAWVAAQAKARFGMDVAEDGTVATPEANG